MLTLALVAMIYTMVSTILIQIARYVRNGREVAHQRLLLLETVEDLRYQLRSLYYPPDQPGLDGKRTPVEGRDTLLFLTTNGRSHKGVVEAGYKVTELRAEDELPRSEQTRTVANTALYYREFPFRRMEFRTLDEFTEAPWKVILHNVKALEFEYSSDAIVWQREWDSSQPPGRIRVRLARGGDNPDRIVFDVTPGVGASRW